MLGTEVDVMSTLTRTWLRSPSAEARLCEPELGVDRAPGIAIERVVEADRTVERRRSV